MMDFFKIEHNKVKPKQGSILIAEPFSRDNFFHRSVVLLAEHNEQGSLGFILNKPVKAKLSDMIEDFPEFDAQISIGGPVSPNSLNFIHTLGGKLPNSLSIGDDIYWGGDIEMLQLMIQGGSIKRHEILFFLGYSGWEAKQLDRELEKDFWLVSKSTSHSIMHHNRKIWHRSLEELGGKYRLWVNFPDDPVHN